MLPDAAEDLRPLAGDLGPLAELRSLFVSGLCAMCYFVTMVNSWQNEMQNDSQIDMKDMI